MDVDFIFITENKNVVGFVASSPSRTIPMKINNIYQISNIFGYGYGDILYSSFNSCFGKITPSNNESDLAKKSWIKKYNSSDWNKETINDIGYYDEEDHECLNYVYDLKPDIKKEYFNKIKECDDKEIIYKGNELCKIISNELYYNREKYYTVGKSQYKNNIKLIL